MKEFCKSLVSLTVEQAKELVKKQKLHPKLFPYKDNLFLPQLNSNVIVLLFNKNNMVVDAFPYDTKIG